jgi:hypothetical protein
MPSRKEIRKKQLAMKKMETANTFSPYHSYLFKRYRERRKRQKNDSFSVL